MKNYIKELKGERKEKRYKQCEECGKLIEQVSNRTKYCEECARKIWEEQNRKNNRERMRKIRSKDKSL
ncbi:hypothetical protein GCM10008905_16600 [Clostridium malenominatum]|uniref:Phage protein n=1 Tax=Clostridium malenominatum TaxID=1539 RepID=A0ABP3U6Q2_9CLOT